MNYYNEWDPYAAQWLRNLIIAGHIPPGDVDERSITDVRPDDLAGYTQCHFFAGIGGWPRALQLAGWPADRPVWTGSCPCQPFSSAGKQKGKDDERHLWPCWSELIRELRPPVVFGEQVASAVAHGWLDDVAHDLEAQGYTIGAAILPACSVGAPHRRDRLWFVADASGGRCREPGSRQIQQPGRAEVIGAGSSMADTKGEPGRSGKRENREDWPKSDFGHPDTLADTDTDRRAASSIGGLDTECNLEPCGAVGHSGDTGSQGCQSEIFQSPWGGYEGGTIAQPSTASGPGFWDGCAWITGADGKSRPVKPGIRLLAHGVSGRMVIRRSAGQGATAHEKENEYSRKGALMAFGNAIIPELGAQFIGAYMTAGGNI